MSDNPLGYTVGPVYSQEAAKNKPRPVYVLPEVTHPCLHPVFNDHDVYPWWQRKCVMCGVVIDVV